MDANAAVFGEDVAILDRLIRPRDGDLPPEAAQVILAFEFDPRDRVRMKELSRKAQDGTLSAAEQHELDSYERIGHLLGLMQSRARRSLKQRG